MTEIRHDDLTKRLLQQCQSLENSLRDFQAINEKAHSIAMIAAIEGARMKDLGTFSIVAQQISQQATINSSLSQKLNDLVHEIMSQALQAVCVRNLELASDLIDKLDRNLFERNCDVQAWASFDVIKQACQDPSEEKILFAKRQLESLVSTYVVYIDSLLIGLNGKLITSAVKTNSSVNDFSNKDWFKSTTRGEVHVSDLYFEESFETHTVCYCAPVTNESGQIVGVLANFFNWEFALEMIQSAGFSSDTRAVFLNKEAQVIGALQKYKILRDSYDWLKAGELAITQTAGFSLERSRNGDTFAIGFCFTKGYNSYRGKSWTALLHESLSNVGQSHSFSIITKKVGSYGSVTSTRENDGLIESERSCKKLLETMKKIDDLVYEINSNNCEVKLLAVNASIQAGLAGSHGEGFSIIANEVANLAKKSLIFVESVNVTTNKLREAVEFSSYIRLADAARDTMSKIDRNLFERFCDIQAWSTFTKFKDILSKESEADEETFALLEKIHKIYEVYHEIYILDLKGLVISTAIHRSIVGMDFSHKEWFKSAINGNVYFSDIYHCETLKQPVISFSSPIYGTNHEIVGVICSQFNCNFLNDILKATIVDSTSDVYLLNSHHMVIASKKTEDVLSLSIDPQEDLKNFQKGHSNMVEFIEPTSEKKRFMGYAFSNGYNTYTGQRWVVVCRKEQSLKNNNITISPEERFQKQLKLIHKEGV